VCEGHAENVCSTQKSPWPTIPKLGIVLLHFLVILAQVLERDMKFAKFTYTRNLDNSSNGNSGLATWRGRRGYQNLVTQKGQRNRKEAWKMAFKHKDCQVREAGRGRSLSLSLSLSPSLVREEKWVNLGLFWEKVENGISYSDLVSSWLEVLCNSLNGSKKKLSA
jgi:hypothetical protein